jgi:hypothetical protein
VLAGIVAGGLAAVLDAAGTLAAAVELARVSVDVTVVVDPPPPQPASPTAIAPSTAAATAMPENRILFFASMLTPSRSPTPWYASIDRSEASLT